MNQNNLSLKYAYSDFRSSKPVLLWALLSWMIAGIALMQRAEADQTPGSKTIVVSQFYYGGGGGVGSTYDANFIELHNLSVTAVSINGWSVQYTDAGAPWTVINLPNTTINPGKYFLIQVGSTGTGVKPLAPDLTVGGTIPQGLGKIAIVNSTTNLGVACVSSATKGSPVPIDLVGYTATASNPDCFEGTGPAPAPGGSSPGSQSTIRNLSGDQDTNNNDIDFTISFAPTARNSTSGATTTTAIKLISFTATSYSNGVWLDWTTGYEIDNLGFNVYRQQNGKKLRLNSSLIAGAALQLGANGTGGYGYAWPDGAQSTPGAKYWLEDIDLSGKSTWHGPVTPRPAQGAAKSHHRSPLLGEVSGVSWQRGYDHQKSGFDIYFQAHGTLVRLNRDLIPAITLLPPHTIRTLLGALPAPNQIRPY